MKTLCNTKLISTTLLAGLILLSLGCGYSKNIMPAQPGTMPTVAQLDPASATANNAVHLEVDGTNFAANAVINFNGAAMATTFVSATKLETTDSGDCDHERRCSTGYRDQSRTSPADATAAAQTPRPRHPSTSPSTSRAWRCVIAAPISRYCPAAPARTQPARRTSSRPDCPWNMTSLRSSYPSWNRVPLQAVADCSDCSPRSCWRCCQPAAVASS